MGEGLPGDGGLGLVTQLGVGSKRGGARWVGFWVAGGFVGGVFGGQAEVVGRGVMVLVGGSGSGFG